MGSPLESFSACSDENERTASVIDAALRATLGTVRTECTMLDCGTGNGKFISDIVRDSGLRCHVFGTDIEEGVLGTARLNYEKAGAASAHTVKADVLEQNSETIRDALGWTSAGGNGPTHGADILLASHIGYFIPSDRQAVTLARISQLVSPQGAMVFTHSDGASQFDELRQSMGKQIHNHDSDAMHHTHERLRKAVGDIRLPSFTVNVPCHLHLPNDEAALRVAWTGEGGENLSGKQWHHVELMEDVISFAAAYTPMKQLREELGKDGLERLWEEFWQPRLEESKGKDTLQIGVAGGKMIFAFQPGQHKLAQQVRESVRTFCQENGLGDAVVSDAGIRPQVERGKGEGRGGI